MCFYVTHVMWHSLTFYQRCQGALKKKEVADSGLPWLTILISKHWNNIMSHIAKSDTFNWWQIFLRNWKLMKLVFFLVARKNY